MNQVNQMKTIVQTTLIALTTATAFAAGGAKVIYSEIATSSTSSVPGALDAGGNPVAAQFAAMFDLVVNHDGSQWVLRCTNNLGTTLDNMLILGSGNTGSVLFQDGQPVPNTVGETFDFFDTVRPVTWDDANRMGLSFRAKGGVTTDDEKLVIWDGTNFTIVMKQNDPYFGLIDIPTNVTGDELVGNSIGSVQLLNSGLLSLVNTPITNCSSFRYPALMHTNTAFRQSGVSPIGGSEIWDSFVLDGAGGTPDGLHWYAEGDTENTNTATDAIFVVDDNIILQEGSLIPGTAMIYADVFHARMLDDGQYYVRGDDSVDNDFALRGDGMVIKTGDPITPGNTELWGVSFANFSGNHQGDWILTGSTSSANTQADTVLVYNGGSVLCREGDPVDVDGNGLFDDNAFINSFSPDDAHLTDSGDVFFIAGLRDTISGTTSNLGDSMIRIEVCGSANQYGTGCVGSGGFTPALNLTGCARAAGNVTLSVNDGLGGSFTVLMFGFGQGNVAMDGGCSLLIQTLTPAILNLPLPGVGPGNGDLSIATQIPGNAPTVTFTMQAFVADPGVPQGFSNSNGLEVTIKG